MRTLSILCLMICLPLAAAANPALIPLPREVTWNEGSFLLAGEVKVSAADPGDALRLIAVLRDAGMNPVRVTGDADIQLLRGEVKNPNGFPGAYHLEVTKAGLVITTSDYPGMVHAAETLRQLMSGKDGRSEIPAVDISDWPAFPVRGFMLDTGRNYQSPELLKEQIEVITERSGHACVDRISWQFTLGSPWSDEFQAGRMAFHATMDSPEWIVHRAASLGKSCAYGEG